MGIDVNAIFEEELLRKGATFLRESEDVYRLQVGHWEITASLANIRRNAERDGDHEAIRRFAEKVLSNVPTPIPDWSDAAPFLLWSAEPMDHDFGDSIRVAVSDEVCRVLTLTDREQTQMLWVTPARCVQWGVTVEQASAAAFANQDRLLEGIQLELATGDGQALGMIPIESPYKASVIFASAFKGLVEPDLGWPVLVVLPCRDFVYVVRDPSPLLGQLGLVVVEEFCHSGYPITTEVLRISDEGIEAIGRFPT